MTVDPFAAPADERASSAGPSVPPPPGKTPLQRITAVLVLVSAGFELFFAMFSVLGMLVGGAFISGLAPEAETGFGVMILVVYVAFFIGSLASGIGHLAAGIQMLKDTPNRTVIWVGSALSLGGLITVYCAPFALLSAILMLVWVTGPSAQARAPSSDG